MSSTQRLVAQVVENGDGGLVVMSPAVGVFRQQVLVGETLVPGSRIGRLQILGRWWPVELAHDAQGMVSESCLNSSVEAVEYDQPLLRLTAVGKAMAQQPSGAATTSDGDGGDSFVVPAPTHGMLYLRPSPQAQAYVSLGQTIEPGAILALIEVMKSFSPITFTQTEGVLRAEVVGIEVEDASEVTPHQPLFVLRPVY